MLSIMLCVNWVCEVAFDDLEWVSENTSAMQVEDVMGRDLNYELCIPCGAVEHGVVLSAHAVESNNGRR